MLDKQQVITKLKDCLQCNSCSDCPHDTHRCLDHLLEDCLDLLEEYPVEPQLNENHAYLFDAFKCGSCGNRISYHAKYCSSCGTPIKWMEFKSADNKTEVSND